MEKDILSAIVEVEEEIRERLIAVERDAGTMLCSIGEELEEEIRREEKRLTEETGRAVTAAEGEARRRAEALVQRAETRAGQLAGVDDGTLERCIMRHLVRILPGERT